MSESGSTHASHRFRLQNPKESQWQIHFSLYLPNNIIFFDAVS